MSFLEILGLIVTIIVCMFLPRFVGFIAIECFMGGESWWFLFVPLCIIGLIFNISNTNP